MADAFHWVIFAFHFTAALAITFGVWLRCDPDVWVSRMRVDTYAVQGGSAGLWWDGRDDALVRRCSAPNSTDARACFDADLPLYERERGDLGWHLFVLLGHFEWISSAFAFYYVRHAWERHSWWISSALALAGTLLFMPFKGEAFVNEVVLLWINLAVTLSVFSNYRSIHKENGETPPPSAGGMVPSQLLDAQLPALRYCEYCITASELWVAVFSVFVQDPPAFMTLGGYTLILLTNLYGLLLHYSLVTENMRAYLASAASAESGSLPAQLCMPPQRRYLRVPESMLTARRRPLGDPFRAMMQRRVWGSYIASNTSTLLNSWLAYLVAVALIFYQQTFLFSSEPPLFVVFAGWSLLISYSSFGIWITLVYWYPDFAKRLCMCSSEKNTYVLAVYGLDILSLASKLSIVGSLSYGFVFRAEGRC
jgi:hypothetical protein